LSKPANIRALPKSFAAAPLILPWRELLWSLSRWRKQKVALFVKPLFQDYHFVRLALPRSSISLTMFESFSGMLVRIIRQPV